MYKGAHKYVPPLRSVLALPIAVPGEIPTMSLFRMDLWFPEAIDYPVQLLTRPVWLVDYTAAMIIATVFAGVLYTMPNLTRV
jgi:hypothetical protein